MAKIKYNTTESRWELIDNSNVVVDYAIGSEDSLPWELTWNNIDIEPVGSVDTTATAGHILEGETAIVRGVRVTGTMANNGDFVFTPTASGAYKEGGYYKSIWVEGDADLVAENIKEGVNIFGITGTLKEGSDITLPTGITVKPENVLDGVFYIDANGNKVEGTMTNHGSVTAELFEIPSSLPEGYYTKIDLPAETMYDISEYTVKDNVVTITPGLVESTEIIEVGTKYTGSTEITPSTSATTIPAKAYIPSTVTVKGDSNLISSNIRSGVSIFGVQGSLEQGSDVTLPTGITVQPGNVLDGIYYIDANGSKVEGTMPNQGNLDIALTKEQQTFNSGYYSGITVPGSVFSGLTNNQIELATSDSTKVLESEYFISNTGELTQGMMPDRGLVEVELTTKEQTLPAGYYASIYVPGVSAGADLTGLTPDNIKYGVTINGVSGTYTTIPEWTGDAPATADDIKTGRGAYVNGAYIQGSRNTEMETITMKPDGSVFSQSSYTNIGSNGSATIEDIWYSNLVVKAEKPNVSDIRKGATLFGSVGTFSADATATAADIAAGKTAAINGVMVTGTMEAGSDVDFSVVTATENQVLEGYGFIDKNGNETAGMMPDRGALSVTLGKTGQVFEGGYYSSITVPGTPAANVNFDSVDVSESDVREGRKFVDGDGNLSTGTMPDRGIVEVELTEEAQILQAGYYGEITIPGVTPSSSGDSTVEFGILDTDGNFQPIDLSGDTPVDSGLPQGMSDLTMFNTGHDEPDYPTSGGTGGDSIGGSGIEFYECAEYIPASESPAGYSFTLTGAPDEDVNGTFNRTLWLDESEYNIEDSTITAKWTNSNGYELWEECIDGGYYYSIKSDIEETIYYLPVDYNERLHDYNGDWHEFFMDESVSLSFSDWLEPGAGSPESWTGYKLTQNAETNEWVKSEELTTGLEVRNYPPTVGKIYSADATVEIMNMKIKTSNALYVWGRDDYGQLGIGGVESRTTPTQSLKTNFKQVSSSDHTLAIDTDGYLWACGDNTDGKLGLGDTTSRSEFVKVGDKKWKYISCGRYNSAAIDEEGYLWTCGGNSEGQLGLGDRDSRKAFTKVTSTNTTKFKAVSCGDTHIVAIDTDGYLWGCGSADFGSSNSGFKIIDQRVWKTVCCRRGSLMVIDTDDYLYAGGDNYWGQLGLGDTSDRSVLTKVGTNRWAQITSYGQGGAAIDTDGYLYTWGYNYYGQLGFGDTTDRNVPTKVGTKKWKYVVGGGSSILAIDEEGYLWACGYNEYGQLGLGDTVNRTVFTQVGTDKWESIAAITRYSSMAFLKQA